MKNAEIHLPYFKQGDDMQACLEHTETVEAAIEQHATQLEAAAKQLREIKAKVAGHDVHIDADTHMIWISGPDDLITSLVEAELAAWDPFEDEWDDWDENERVEDDEDDA